MDAAAFDSEERYIRKRMLPRAAETCSFGGDGVKVLGGQILSPLYELQCSVVAKNRGLADNRLGVKLGYWKLLG